MSEIAPGGYKFENGVIIYHFNVEQHSISAEQLICTANATSKILRNFGNILFRDEVQIELRITTPETGGVKIFYVVVASTLAFLEIADNSIVKAVTKDLSGHEPVYWAVEGIREIRRNFSDDERGNLQPQDSSEFDVGAQKSSELAAQILSGAATHFLESRPDKLERAGYKKTPFRDAYLAKDDILQSCIDDPAIEGLGFDASNDFKIDRNNFENYMMYPRRKVKIEANGEIWIVETMAIDIISPVEGEDREWTGKAGELGKIEFWMYDWKYLESAKSKSKAPKVRDKIHVQLAYQADGKKPKNFYVLKVLKVNGRRIGNRLNPGTLKKALSKMLGEEFDMPERYEVLIAESEEEKVRLQVRWSE